MESGSSRAGRVYGMGGSLPGPSTPSYAGPVTRLATALILGCASTLTLGCGDDEVSRTVGTGGAAGAAPTTCVAGERLVGAECLSAGTRDDGCPAGARLEGAACVPAGIPPERCGEGFEADGDHGCEPILPETSCPAGQLALPGETSCHEVAPCGDGPWGDIPVDETTQYVDGSYAGGGSDGSELSPWTSIQAAVDAAESGALIAVAAGSYPEDVWIGGKAVRIWGRCPSMVEVAGTGAEAAAVVVNNAAAGGTEIHQLAVRGSAGGVRVNAAVDVELDRLWLHDLEAHGVDIDRGAQAVLQHSLVEMARETGVMVSSATADIEGVAIRDTKPGPSLPGGEGIIVWDNPLERSRATIRGCVVERNYNAGVLVLGSDATIEDTVVLDTVPHATIGMLGIGMDIEASIFRPERAVVTVRSSYVSRSGAMGMYVDASDVLVEDTVIRETSVTVPTDLGGRGIELHCSEAAGPSRLTLRRSLLAHHEDLGLFIGGAEARVEDTRIQDMHVNPVLGDGGYGVSVQPGTLSLRGQLTMEGSVVERALAVGIAVFGSDAWIEGTALLDTRFDAPDLGGANGLLARGVPTLDARSFVMMRASIVDGYEQAGVFVVGSDVTLETVRIQGARPDARGDARGIAVQPDPDGGDPATTRVYVSVVDGSLGMGLAAFAGLLEVADTLVIGSQARQPEGLFGDGLFLEGAGEFSLSRCRIESSTRAAVAAFGSAVQVGETTMECNAIDLTGDEGPEGTFDFEDLGGNVCGCGVEELPCTVLSSVLTPPEPLAPVGSH